VRIPRSGIRAPAVVGYAAYGQPIRQLSRNTEFQNVDVSSWHEVHCGRSTIACSVSASPSTCAWLSDRRSCKRHGCARNPRSGIRARKKLFVYHADQVSVVFMS
jgi:hypothetical protein